MIVFNKPFTGPLSYSLLFLFFLQQFRFLLLPENKLSVVRGGSV